MTEHLGKFGAIGPETFIFSHLLPAIGASSFLPKPWVRTKYLNFVRRAYFKKTGSWLQTELLHLHKSTFEAWLESILQITHGSEEWTIEKTPGHAPFIDLVVPHLTEVVVIELRRDLPSCLLSVLRAGWSSDSVFRIAAKWKRSRFNQKFLACSKRTIEYSDLYFLNDHKRLETFARELGISGRIERRSSRSFDETEPWKLGSDLPFQPKKNETVPQELSDQLALIRNLMGGQKRLALILHHPMANLRLTSAVFTEMCSVKLRRGLIRMSLRRFLERR